MCSTQGTSVPNGIAPAEQERLHIARASAQMEDEGCPNPHPDGEVQSGNSDVRLGVHGGVMMPISEERPMGFARMDRALEYAVVLCWKELLGDVSGGRIQIEYETGADGTLNFLKVWSSTVSGAWSLICEVWMRPLWSHQSGVRFGHGYEPFEFALILGLVLERQNAFAKLPDGQGRIQVPCPTQTEHANAERWMTVAFEQLDVVPARTLAS